MLIFGAYQGQRLTFDVPIGMTVLQLKEMIQDRLGISVDLYKHDKKVLVLSYAGADMGDDWVFSDLGIVPGSTIRVQLKEEVKPVLYIKCSHSQDTISIFDNITIAHMRLDEVRSLASSKSGLPVGIFRLTTLDGREMFDHHRLEDYGVDVGHTICLQNWDGWNEFLNLAIMGFTPQVISQLSTDDIVCRYQMKVAMFIAAHFGHIDLARAMLRQGIKCDEPTGYHPARTWCKNQGHIEALTAPVHEATLRGQLGVLRLFVNHDITCLKAKDGKDLEPLNIALRNKVKNCASFILTKQWTKVNITKNFTLHLATYLRLKKWCERAKERALLKYGQAKSTLRRRNFQSGPLIGHGLLVDGFSQSPMTGKPKAVLQKEEKEEREKERRRPKFTVPVAEVMGSTEEPETYFKTVSATQTLRQQGKIGSLGGPTRWGKIMAAKGKGVEETSRDGPADTRKAVTLRSPGHDADKTEDESEAADEATKLPPILQRMRLRLTSHPVIQPLDESTAPPPRGAKTERDKVDAPKGPMSRLIKNKNAYFMTSSTNSSQTNPAQSNTAAPRASLHLPLGQGSNSSHPPPPSERSDKSKLETSQSVISEPKPQTAYSLTSTESHAEDGENEEKKTTKGRASKAGKKKRGRVSSALLLSKANASEGSIPLPLISHEQDRRPFFYHQGCRQDDLVESTLELLSKYKNQSSSRERAIESLSVANTFRDKPWLGQVRLALSLTSNALKRNVRSVRRLRHGAKRVSPTAASDRV